MRSVAVGSLMALLVGAGLAQGQPPVRQASGGIGREAMYLRLFQEIANFEAEADALEATGVQPTELRSYHQKRLGLSEAHAVLLKQTALDCVQNLRSSGTLARRGGTRPLMPTAGTVRAGMARVSAAVESLRTTMGPGEFAYLDATVRRYVSPVGAPWAAIAPTSNPPSRTAPMASQPCTLCNLPDGEIDYSSTLLAWNSPSGAPMLGGVFGVQLLVDGTALPPQPGVTWTVTEELGDEIDGGHDVAAQDGLPNPPQSTLTGAGYASTSSGTYRDWIGDSTNWVNYYVAAARANNPGILGCSEYNTQWLSASCSNTCMTNGSYQTNYPGAAVTPEAKCANSGFSFCIIFNRYNGVAEWDFYKQR